MTQVYDLTAFFANQRALGLDSNPQPVHSTAVTSTSVRYAGNTKAAVHTVAVHVAAKKGAITHKTTVAAKPAKKIKILGIVANKNVYHGEKAF